MMTPKGPYAVFDPLEGYPVAVEVSWVAPLVVVRLDQQGSTLRGPLAVCVPHGQPPPRMVPGVSDWGCAAAAAAPSRV